MIALVLLLAAVARAESPECRFSLKSPSDRQPLFLRPGETLNASSLLFVDSDGVVSLPENSSIILACPGRGNHLTSLNGTLRQTNATCVGGALNVRRAAVEARALACAKPVERTVEPDGGRRCGAGGRGVRVRVGFRLLHGFLKLITACFDDTRFMPIYSNYTLTKKIADIGIHDSDNFHNSTRFIVGFMYKSQFQQQRETLHKLLGFIVNDTLVPEPLDSRSTIAYPAEKNAPFSDVNMAPQWVSVKNGAWAAVERAARNLAARRGDLTMLAGIHGVATLSDAQGRPTELFLYVQGKDREIAVPAVFWKVIYDSRTKEGAAILVNNNPLVPKATPHNLPLCPDICGRLRWLPEAVSKNSDVYCCDVQALQQRVEDLPPLRVQGLLESTDDQELTLPESSTIPSSQIGRINYNDSLKQVSAGNRSHSMYSIVLVSLGMTGIRYL